LTFDMLKFQVWVWVPYWAKKWESWAVYNEDDLQTHCLKVLGKRGVAVSCMVDLTHSSLLPNLPNVSPSKELTGDGSSWWPARKVSEEP